MNWSGCDWQWPGSQLPPHWFPSFSLLSWLDSASDPGPQAATSPETGAGRTRDGLRLYALTELLIGASALLVPYELSWGRLFLERVGSGPSLSAGLSYLLSGYLDRSYARALVRLHGCNVSPSPCLQFESDFLQESPRSFSYLYLANVCGAMTGALIPLFFIEEWGFTANPAHRRGAEPGSRELCLYARDEANAQTPDDRGRSDIPGT